VNAIEAGHMVPSTILALKLAKVLGVTVEELFAIEVRQD
jgi:putative transcriptional regulator